MAFTDIIGQGVATTLLPTGTWVGSIDHINPARGYWVELDRPDLEAGETITFSFNGYQVGEDYIYNLDTNPNLESDVNAKPIELPDQSTSNLAIELV